MAEYLVQSESLTAIADEIRTLSGTTEAMGLDAMATHIGDANASVGQEMDLIEQIATALEGKGQAIDLPELSNQGLSSDLLLGKELIDSEGNVVTGTMPNLSTKTSITFDEDNLTPIIDGDAVFIKENTDNISRILIRYTGENGYLQNNTLFGHDSSAFGNADHSQVLSGATFTSSNGIHMTGTISTPANSSNATLSSTDSRKVVVGKNDHDGVGGFWDVTNSDGQWRICTSIPTSGYYRDNDIIGIPAQDVRYMLTSGTSATANDIVSGKNAYSNGQLIIGTHTCTNNVLNFEVVGGTAAPANPIENTIWINTDQTITSWHLDSDEPNVYNIQPISSSDPWVLVAPHTLHEGDIINFTIPATVSSTYEAIRLYDNSTGKLYCVRAYGGAAGTGWTAGTKVGLKISNNIHGVGDWYGNGSAYVSSWASYYHEEGTAWITTSTSSFVGFNSLKNNNMMTYPIYAKQYINGAWVDKTAKTYQNGAWVDWSVYLYNSGDTCNIVTGGWTEVQSSSGGTYSGKTVMNETSIYVFAESESSGYSYAKGRATANAIDLTRVSRIRAKGNCSNARSSIISAGVGIAVLSSHSLNTIIADCYVTQTGDFDITLDVSNLSGMYYVACYAKEATQSGYSSIATDGEGTFSQIWYQ